MMRALRYSKDGGLKVEEVPKPAKLEGNDVLVRVKATAITRGELEWPESKERESPIPGHDVAGIIEAVGDRVSAFEPGDEVFALIPFTRDGAAAEYALVPSHDLAIKPPGSSFVEAASIPLSALTAYQALFTHADAQPGQRILITGAGGGVGVMAVQIAAAVGMVVTAICSADKIPLVKELGANQAFDYHTTPLNMLSHNYDIILDTVGSGTLPQCFHLLKGKGKLICVARPPTADEKAQRPDVSATFFIVEPDGEELTRIAQCVEQEHIQPIVQMVLPLEEGAKAFEMVEDGHAKGKVVLRVDEEERVDSPQQGV